MKQKDILFILISSFILTVVWIGFSLYSSAVTSTISETQGMQITGISSNFNQEAINAIKSRSVVSPLFESQIEPSITPTLPEEAVTLEQPLEQLEEDIATSEAELSTPEEFTETLPSEDTGFPNL